MTKRGFGVCIVCVCARQSVVCLLDVFCWLMDIHVCGFNPPHTLLENIETTDVAKFECVLQRVLHE